MNMRYVFLPALLVAIVGISASPQPARAENFFDWLLAQQHHRHRAHVQQHKAKTAYANRKPHRLIAHASSYGGAMDVAFASGERPGTIIIKTEERALYRVLGNGKARRYGVAVGKEGFAWSGVARVGMKRVNPVWTPPPAMIEREPRYAKWADGMPGGTSTNPLGPRALYLYDGGDTGYRIHGTIHPESIGHAASSGCIRMLNSEVIELFSVTPVGTKVIVL